MNQSKIEAMLKDHELRIRKLEDNGEYTERPFGPTSAEQMKVNPIKREYIPHQTEKTDIDILHETQEQIIEGFNSPQEESELLKVSSPSSSGVIGNVDNIPKKRGRPKL